MKIRRQPEPRQPSTAASELGDAADLLDELADAVTNRVNQLRHGDGSDPVTEK